MKGNVSYKRVVVTASLSLAALGLALLLSYVAWGHAVIKLIYDSHFSIVDLILEARKSTPIEDYLVAMDEKVLRLGAYFVLVGALGLILLTNPVGVVFCGASFGIGSFAIFLVLDLFPPLVKPLHFDMIPYFNYRLTYVPDPVLGFREKPFNRAHITNFRGFDYSPSYGIDVRPETMIWQTDGEGFRNAPNTYVADVAVIGSSFIEYGNDLADTYPGRLEKKLGGLKVANLGKAGYGPVQFLEVLKRYALEKKPRYVLFAFYPPSDVDLHLGDLTTGREDVGLAKRSVAFGGLFSRYGIALQQTWGILSSGWWTVLQLGFQGMVGSRSVHPDVAVLRLPNNVTKKIFFIDRHSEKSADDLLRSPNWRALETILVAFKQVSEQNRIVPLMVYIPTASEIYAPYSTSESGINWLRSRESQIATSGNSEEAARRLAAKVGIELISFLPAFKEAALQGQLLYYGLDDHWNSEGREIAARVTAQAVNIRSKATKNPEPANPENPEVRRKNRQSGWGSREAVFDSGKDSVMRRSVGGRINFWNRRAEQLYGWTKDQALGQISHKLLKTKFPEPLEQIDAELVRNGKWEGKLVHATRDGRRLVVESRWVLNREEPPAEVVEINTDLSSISQDFDPQPNPVWRR